MLVITRKPGEKIRIGDDIKIQIISVKGKTIRVGIEADEKTLILRDEVFQRHEPPKDPREVDLSVHPLN